MNRYAALFGSLGAATRPGADPAAIARAEKVLAVRFPEEFRDLYRTTDGLVIPDLRLEFVPLSEMEGYAGFLTAAFGYAPFTECHDSNPYAVCCDEPLTGFVVHLFHDDEPVLVCRSLGRFLDLVAERQRQARGATEEQLDDLVLPGNPIPGDLAFEQPERTADDARVGGELIRHAESLSPRDVDRTAALLFAAQMFGPGREADLARVLALGDEYVRGAVLRRWRGLGTPAAEALLRRDAEEFDRFVAELAEAVEAAGMAIRRHPPPGYGFTIEDGNIGLNFGMLYCSRHEPEFLPGLVERVRRWQFEKTASPLERLARSGLIRSWIESRGGEWDHGAWQEFLRDATSRFGVLPADQVGLLLEQEKARYWERRRAAGQSGDPS